MAGPHPSTELRQALTKASMLAEDVMANIWNELLIVERQRDRELQGLFVEFAQLSSQHKQNNLLQWGNLATAIAQAAQQQQSM